MNKELEALEQAIATLEMFFQSIEFPNEEAALKVRRRLSKAEARLGDLVDLCSPLDMRNR